MKVTIVGGGIAGLTAAVALKQKGIEATVYEAAPEIKPVGAGIWIAANAMAVMKRLGLDKEIKSRGMVLEETIIGDVKGNSIQVMKAVDMEKRYGEKSFAILRSELYAILCEQLDSNQLIVGKKMERFREEGSKIFIRFADGSATDTDVLIGADGIHSIVRKQLMGEIPLRYSGQTAWRGIADYTVSSALQNKAYELLGPEKGLRFGFSPVKRDKIYFYAVLKTPPYGKQGQLNPQTYLKELFNEFPSYVKDIIRSTPNDRIMRHDLFDFEPIPNWYKGNCILIGDAAHATTPNLGQGGCQAIEDGFVLAFCLSEEKSVDRAFARFQSLRMPKAQQVVIMSYSFAKLNNLDSRWANSLRNAVLRMVPSFVSWKQLDDIYRLNY